jgi:eukaryotic-like serine/threonine-protein kinase
MADPTKADDSGARQSLEVAHVLFIDLVGYSLLATDAQQRVLKELQEAVRQTAEFQRAQGQNDLICLPTGDGMALVFFREPEAPVRCALELSKALRKNTEIYLRMGIHSGPVYRMADINANLNVAGGGINIAQRVMDCGDAEHILVSEATADTLNQVGAWKESLEDLGEAEVKHGLRLRLFNLCTEEAGNAERPTKFRLERARRVRRSIAWTLAAVLVAGAVSAWLIYGRRAHALGEADTVVLADFDNKTGDAVFDDALKQALSVSLRQSPFLNIVSEERIGKTLKLMTRPADTKLTPGVAREVCQREASKAYIAGSIASLGAHYVVGLNAVNCQTGDVLAQQQAEADGKEKVLDAMGTAAGKLREELGESLSTVEKFATPLAEATTASLEALKAYSVGMIKDRKNDTEAIPFFQRAIELDPKFASAYEGLAVSYLNLGETGVARENFTKAFDLRERANERERLVITVRYYQYVTGQLDKAIEEYQVWAQAYPRDARARGNLGGLYGATGRFVEAVAQTDEALRLNPDSGANYANLVLSYTALDQLQDARRIYEQAVAHGIDDPLTRVSYFGVAFLEGDAEEMNRQMAWSEGKAGAEDIFLSAKSDAEAYDGRLAAAREDSRRAVESALHTGEKETAALWKLDGALREAEFGNFDRARREAASALAIFANHDSEILAALTMARAGDAAQAEKLASELASRYPLDTLLNSYWLPVIRASEEISRKNAAQAEELLEGAKRYELASPDTWPGMGAPVYPIYLRGECLLLEHQGGEAAKEFQKLLEHRGLRRASPLGPRAQLGLARAYALAGDVAQAKAAYQEFFTLWKDADSGVPLVAEANTEYRKLE